MNALEIRARLQEAKMQYGRKEITVDQLYAVADEYIAAIKAYKARTKDKKLKIPSRGYLIRAI